MFLPAGTVIRISSSKGKNREVETSICVVQEILFDFDPDFINGVKVKTKEGKEMYVDDIHYRIEEIAYPRDYFHPKWEWYVLYGKLEKFSLFCSDRIYVQNRWMHHQMDVVVRLSKLEYPTFSEAFRLYKIKYRLTV